MTRSRWPSGGFVAIVLTYALSTAFLAWGMTTPPLDRVWQLHHELKVGKEKKLKKRDRQLLEAALERHPGLGSALLPSGRIGLISAHREGWIDTPHVVVVRTPSSDATALVLDVQTPPQNLPFTAEISGRGWKSKRDVERRERVELPLPAAPSHSELVLLSLRGKGLRDDPSSLAVQVTFARPDAPEPAGGGENDEDEDVEEGDDETDR